MTVIVAVTSGRHMAMAGDSATTAGNTKIASSTPKVFKITQSMKKPGCEQTDLLFGSAGIGTIGQIIYHHLGTPISNALSDFTGYPMSWITNRLIPLLKPEFEAFGVQTDDESGWNILICLGGRIFVIWQDWHVMEVEDFGAIGSGMQCGLAAMEAMWDLQDDWLDSQGAVPEMEKEMATRAVKIVCKYDIWCSEPVVAVTGVYDA